MDEYVDILDPKGVATGKQILKSEAHKKGVFHPTVHIWFYTADGFVLIQQRAKNKDTFPMHWDVSVAGHIEAGEPIVDAAIREVHEEIGVPITPNELKNVGVFKSEQRPKAYWFDNEFHNTFVCLLSVPLSQLIKQESEVADIKLISINDLETEVIKYHGTHSFVPHDEDYYIAVINKLKEVIEG
ncbi:MAG: NUDIX domain-containing protein [Eudoraea sp.]|nr:NUDIX domain-containing protein [Eudoraea sp.]